LFMEKKSHLRFLHF